MSGPDQEQAISKALKFADTALGVEIEKSNRDTQDKIAHIKAEASSRGTLMSGRTLAGAIDIHSEKITNLLGVRLELLLEGFTMYGANLDDGLVERVIRELGEYRSNMIHGAGQALAIDPVFRTLSVSYSGQFLEQRVGMRSNEIRTRLERSRHMPKKSEGNTINVYHVHGSNNRWLTNSQDYSVNAVTQSSDQIFSNLRQEIHAKIPSGAEKQDILERLTALEQAENQPSFKQRYVEFISAAANHMQLLAPFIPALTEMLHKAL